MTTDYTELASRLREHAEAHASVTPHDDEQRQWAEDLRRSADLVKAMGQQEPDGEVVAGTGSLNDVAMIRWCSDYRPKIGDRIYAAPQPQEQREPTGDWQSVLVANLLRFDCPLTKTQIHGLIERAMSGEPTEAQIEEYEILCNDEWVAGASGPGARAEIAHYLTQYEQDGPCEVYAVTRTLVDRAALAVKE